MSNWKKEKNVDNGGLFDALLTDFPNAFDCFSHEQLLAKLHTYGFDKRSLVWIYNYLSSCKQSSFGVKFYLEFHKYLY